MPGLPCVGLSSRACHGCLFRHPLPALRPQEDKVAGCNMLAHWMLKGGGAARWRAELAELERLYSQGHVFWW